MGTERFKTGATIPVMVKFEDQNGNGIPGATGVLTLQRVSDDQYWNGSAFQVTPFDLAMTEISEANSLGRWDFSFDSSNGLDIDDYIIEVRDTSGNAKNEFDIDRALVGDYLDTVEDKIDVVDANVDAILIDTNEMQGKLPTNNIMGSSVKTDKDDEIDAIKAKTDALPVDPASETNIDANEAKIDIIDTNVDAIVAKLPSSTISDFEETTDPVEILASGGTAGKNAAELVDDNWREPLADHSGESGSMAEALDDADATADPSAVADAVWDESLADHLTTGSTGEALNKTLGLMFENSVMEPLTFQDDGNGNKIMVTGEQRVYNSKANAETDDGVTGLDAKYSITQAHVGDKLTKYTQVLEP